MGAVASLDNQLTVGVPWLVCAVFWQNHPYKKQVETVADLAM